MLNGCLVCYVQLLMCNWTLFFTTSNIDHRRPIRERININKNRTNMPPLTYIGLRNWGLLKGRRAPAPSQCTLWMLELRLLRNHPRKALFKIKTPLRSAELTSANIASHDLSWRASAASHRRRRLWAALTGDLTAHGYCSFQVTKFDKKLTSVT